MKNYIVIRFCANELFPRVVTHPMPLEAATEARQRLWLADGQVYRVVEVLE